MSIPFGSNGSYFVLINMFILAYGAMIAYLLIIKDTVPVILDMVDTGDGNFWEREVIMIVTSLVIVVPLSMARDMASLAATSLLSVVADAILVGFVIGFSPVRSTVSEYGGFLKVMEDNWINSKLFIGLGVLSTAMACQHSAFIVSGSLENKTASRWGMVTSRSISISAAMCIMMGVTGYLGFLGETHVLYLSNGMLCGSTRARQTHLQW
jgi:sodium-coupled neutral amino acid transporter 11